VEYIWSLKVKGQGHWERKCKTRFSCIILVKSGSIYVTPWRKWSTTHSTHMVEYIWHFNSGNNSFSWYLFVIIPDGREWQTIIIMKTKYRPNDWWTGNIHRVRKKTNPLKHVQITLWIENDSHYFSLCHEKPSICNVFVKFHDNQSVHCWDIAFYKKMVENCRRQHCQ